MSGKFKRGVRWADNGKFVAYDKAGATDEVYDTPEQAFAAIGVEYVPRVDLPFLVAEKPWANAPEGTRPSKVEALLDALWQALYVKGRSATYHEAQVAYVRQHWSVLWDVVTQLAAQSHDASLHPGQKEWCVFCHSTPVWRVVVATISGPVFTCSSHLGRVLEAHPLSDVSYSKV